jgi:hypothetical protein
LFLKEQIKGITIIIIIIIIIDAGRGMGGQDGLRADADAR